MDYFLRYEDEIVSSNDIFVSGLNDTLCIKVGDVLKIFYSKRGSSFFLKVFVLL